MLAVKSQWLQWCHNACNDVTMLAVMLQCLQWCHNACGDVIYLRWYHNACSNVNVWGDITTCFGLLQLNIENTSIDRVCNFNFLGLTINQHLNWKSRIDKLTNKISKTMGVLNKLKHLVPLNARVIYIIILQFVCVCLCQFVHHLSARSTSQVDCFISVRRLPHTFTLPHV